MAAEPRNAGDRPLLLNRAAGSDRGADPAADSQEIMRSHRAFRRLGMQPSDSAAAELLGNE
jgi:hypothetical protein